MKSKVYSIVTFALYAINLIFAQDPPPLPDAPTQGPISGLFFLVIGGALVAIKRYFGNSK